MNKLLDDDDITSNLSVSTKRNKSYKNKEFTYNSALNEEEIQLKMLENLQPRKYKRDYVEKFVTLLHESKSLKHKYSLQRRKLRLSSINKSANKNKGIYITLPKINSNTPYINTNDNNNDKNTITFPQYLLDEEENKNDNNKNNNDYNSLLTDTVRDILHKDEINNQLDSYKEREKLLYEFLKTKKKFHTQNRRNLYSSTEVNQLNYNSPINEKRHNFLSPKFLRNFDTSLAKTIERKNAKLLTDNQVKKLYYISELKLFDSLDEIRRKNKMLKEIKNCESKRYLNNIDMFKYDKDKWNKKRQELNKNINEIMFNKFDKENKRYLLQMKKGVDKVQDNANCIQKDLGKLFTDVNDFIQKNSEYIKENSQKGSKLNSKRGSFIRKSTRYSIIK